MKFIAILLITSTFCSITHAQSADGVQKQIVGKWTMVRHTLEQKGAVKDRWTAEYQATYTFKPDGTWMSTFWQKSFGTVVSVGQWKVVGNGKRIRLHNNKFLPPHDKDGLLGDHDLNVIKLSATEFVTNEYLFAEDPVGTSYYVRTS